MEKKYKCVVINEVKNGYIVYLADPKSKERESELHVAHEWCDLADLVGNLMNDTHVGES